MPATREHLDVVRETPSDRVACLTPLAHRARALAGASAETRTRHIGLLYTSGPRMCLFHVPTSRSRRLSIAVAVHDGPYDQLSETYASLERWIESKGFRRR